jgi:uncharacterized protein
LTAIAVDAATDFHARPDGRELWRQSLAVQRLPDLRSDITLTTTASGTDVTLQIHGVGVLLEDGVKRALMSRVIAGGGLVGTAFLSIEHADRPDDLWIYLPAVGWPRRLLGGDLGDSYLGSEFRYGDLVQPDPAAYEVTLLGSETVDGGTPCWVIEAVPRDRQLARDSGLGREIHWLERDRLVERRVEQYDRAGRLLKVMELDRWMATAGGKRWLPLERRIRNVQDGASSRAVFENIEVGIGLPSDLFTSKHMAERSW